MTNKQQVGAAMRAKALALAAEGFPVIQLYSIGPNGQCNCSAWLKRHGKCKPGKHPAMRKGGYNLATTDPRRIKRWFKHRRNIGIATAPGHLIALDPDARNGGDVVLAGLVEILGPLPPTRAFQSGSGDVRYLFRLPADVAVSTGQITRPTSGPSREIDRLDVIADTGGLIVAGIHKSGKPYVDLGGTLAELPKPWGKAFQIELPLLFSPFPTLLPIGRRYSERNGEEEENRSERNQPLPAQLHTAKWIWERLRPGAPWPELYTAVRCLFCDDGELPGSGFVVSDAGHVLFHCFHANRSYPLQEVYARLVLKTDLPTGDKALAKWRDDMYLESGAVARPEVHFDPCPEASVTVQRVYLDVIDRLAHNWVSFPGEPVMYTASFGALRLGLHKQAVKEALITLQAFDVLRKVGQVATSLGKANLWLTTAEVINRECQP